MQLTARPQPKPEKEQAARAPVPPGKKRLSYLEAREWEQMEARILEAEQSLETLRAELQAASANPLELQPAYERMQSAEQSVEQLYARWAELEAKQQ